MLEKLTKQHNKDFKKLILELTKYEKYVGCYVKRFYTEFLKENIQKILKYRLSEHGIPEFLCVDTFWYDIEDSVIITNELPIVEDSRVANVNSSDYKGYNPYDENKC